MDRSAQEPDLVNIAQEPDMGCISAQELDTRDISKQELCLKTDLQRNLTWGTICTETWHGGQSVQKPDIGDHLYRNLTLGTICTETWHGGQSVQKPNMGDNLYRNLTRGTDLHRNLAWGLLMGKEKFFFIRLYTVIRTCTEHWYTVVQHIKLQCSTV